MARSWGFCRVARLFAFCALAQTRTPRANWSENRRASCSRRCRRPTARSRSACRLRTVILGLSPTTVPVHLPERVGPRRSQHEAARRPHETLTPGATAFALRRFGLPTVQLQPLWQRRAARAFGQLALVSFSLSDIPLGGPFGRAIGLPLPFPARSRSSSGRLAPVHL